MSNDPRTSMHDFRAARLGAAIVVGTLAFFSDTSRADESGPSYWLRLTNGA